MSEEHGGGGEGSEAPAIRKRPRRTHARRSCQMCQQRKARCELPDLTVPSGPGPLADHLACHRCKTLQISCIVDDSNKKRGRKLTESKGTHETPARPTLDRAATTGELTIRAKRISLAGGDEAEGLGTADDARSRDRDRRLSRPRLVSRTPSPSGMDPGSPTALEAEVRHVKAIRSISGMSASQPLDIDGWEKYSIRSRPYTLLTELIPRQRGFASRTSRLISEEFGAEADIRDVVDDDKSAILSEWCEEHLTLWMPHLSNAQSIRQANQGGHQSVASQLLEAALYLVALQHLPRTPEDDVLRFSVARLVVRDLGRVMLSAPREARALEALELLAIFPIDVSVLAGPSKNRIRTDGLMTVAERLARSLRIDRLALGGGAPQPPIAGSSSGNIDSLDTSRRAVEWLSIKAWHTCFTLGDDELFESVSGNFADANWMRSLLPRAPPSDGYASAYGMPGLPLHASGGSPLSKRDAGTVGVIMRGILLERAMVSMGEIKAIPNTLDDHERVHLVDAIQRQWRNDFAAIEAERARELPESDPSSALIADWLAVEAANLDLTITGLGCLKTLGIEPDPATRVAAMMRLMREKQLNPVTFQFLAVHAERRLDAAESVLRTTAKLTQRDYAELDTPVLSRGATTASATSSSPLSNASEGRSNQRLPVPMVNVVGYAFEAALTAVEMHAKVIKAWRKLPARSESWQSAFQAVIRGLESVDSQGTVENGSIPATGAFIIKGMLEVLTMWTVFSKRCAAQNAPMSLGAEDVGCCGLPPRAKGVGLVLQDPLKNHPGPLDEGDLNYRLNMTTFAASGLHSRHGPLPPVTGTLAPTTQVVAPSLTASLFEAGQNGGALAEPWPRAYPFDDPAMGGGQLDTYAQYLGPSTTRKSPLPPPQSFAGMPGGVDLFSQDAGVDWMAEDQIAKLFPMPSADAAQAATPQDHQSIESILNEILGSNEWSGVLDDILARA
ncbi:uncharacterized protein PFL1_00173 [Pseudozyma flocculosa PF-1]|uniref:Zn(2)-C6 fungal-type domain-containing protein n=1 Tax=Pseudozyma flocculosa TaxID=84751 RepID=A0A5C3ES05_9BASI|nr:uncharacterized protein PFL1_00173 [Pseudozyma flocculosa PF-1]EPQ31975.1 hypothetical protein PFL1_00173 [Pseudozyma flocculosa PF-1]SPO35103.1 uncharacterized protein PSFLO_00574 [Pseudozyma flocculosa]